MYMYKRRPVLLKLPIKNYYCKPRIVLRTIRNNCVKTVTHDALACIGKSISGETNRIVMANTYFIRSPLKIRRLRDLFLTNFSRIRRFI